SGTCQMGDRRRRNVTAPAILDGHRYAAFDAQIPHQLRSRETADLGNLQVDDVHRVLLQTAQQHAGPGDHLVEDERSGGPAANRQAFLEGRAWLFDIDVDIGYGGDNARRFDAGPARIGIGHEDFPRLQD